MRPRDADVWAGLLAAAVFVAAAVAGGLLGLAGRPVHAGAAPLFGHWLPHAGPGTPFAVAIAALGVWQGPVLADRLRWRPLLAVAYGTAVAWTLSLAMVDGWHRGVVDRLTTPYEYLSEVNGVTDAAALLRGFTARILDGGTDPWTTHVAGHPPGALLVFVGLDRLGLGGGAWAAMASVLAGAAVAVAVPVTVKSLGGETAARACVPFVALFPGAVWIGVSADGLFAGVAATAVALLAIGLTGPSRYAALAAGILFAVCGYLSYGLVLLAPLALAVALIAGRLRPLVWTVAGAALVVITVTVAGFSWMDGLRLTHERYDRGLADRRPYGYWVGANLGALVACAGPALAPVLRRATVARTWLVAPVLLPLAAAAAIVFADLSGLSKAEVERIWLPFAVWLPAGVSLLPADARRRWLAVQAGVALLVNHLVLTGW